MFYSRSIVFRIQIISPLRKAPLVTQTQPIYTLMDFTYQVRLDRCYCIKFKFNPTRAKSLDIKCNSEYAPAALLDAGFGPGINQFYS